MRRCHECDQAGKGAGQEEGIIVRWNGLCQSGVRCREIGRYETDGIAEVADCDGELESRHRTATAHDRGGTSHISPKKEILRIGFPYFGWELCIVLEYASSPVSLWSSATTMSPFTLQIVY